MDKEKCDAILILKSFLDKTRSDSNDGIVSKGINNDRCKWKYAFFALSMLFAGMFMMGTVTEYQNTKSPSNDRLLMRLRRKKNKNRKYKNKNEKIHQVCKIKQRNKQCEKLCLPAKCCFKDEKCPNNAEKTTFCPKYSNCDYFYSKREGVTIPLVCPPDKCCKECADNEAMNAKVTTKNDAGQDFAFECARKINNEVHDHYESYFALLFIELCLNDWNALESNLDIDFIEQDNNYY